jgi:hypothetical protein
LGDGEVEAEIVDFLVELLRDGGLHHGG